MHDLALRMRNGMAKVATGACRSGKSRLLLNLFGDHLRAQGRRQNTRRGQTRRPP